MPDPIVTERIADSPSSQSGYGPRYQRAFTVLASSESDAREVLKGQIGIDEGTPYQDHQGKIPDQYCICVDRNARPITPVPVDGTGLFDVVCNFAYEDDQGYRRRIPANGQTRRYLRRSITSISVDRDIHGNPITNAADEPIDPPLQKLVVDKVLVIEWWKMFATWAHAEAYCSTYDGKVNSETYYSAPPWCLLCLGIDPEESPIMNSSFGMKPYKLTGQFQFQPTKVLKGPDGNTHTYGGWRANPLNWGRKTKNFVNNKTFHIFQDKDGNYTRDQLAAGAIRLADPVLLTADGNSWTDRANANYRDIENYDAVDFNSLGV